MHGKALRFTGAQSGHAYSAGPVLDTARSLTVAAWVRPSALDSWSTAVGQEGVNISGFALGYNAYPYGSWSFTMPSTDAMNGPASALASAKPPVQLGEWTHLAEVYDAAGRIPSRTLGYAAQVSLGPRLRELRRRAGLTQPELAARATVSVRAVRDIESGRVSRPRPSSMDRIAAALGLSDEDRAAITAAGEPAEPRVGILGPLEFRDGRLGSPMQQTVLGLLALHAHQPVTRDEIVDVVWGDAPPRTCLTQVQVAIGRLRDLFEPRRGRSAGSAIASVAAGYRLTVRTDADRFEELLGQGLLDEALDLWRGPVLAGAADRLRGHPAAVRLGQLRMEATMRSGRLPRLRALAAGDPLHEDLHARLMLALAAAGDRACALRVYAELRKRLVEELGVEPSGQVQRVYLSLLDDRRGGVSAADRIRPAQLPPDVPRLAGRQDVLRRLDDMLGAGGIATLSGTAGVGKSALAVHWAHRVAARYPDGQLYVNLRGFDPGGQVMAAADAVRAFLDSLGVSPERIPPSLEAQVGLYRSLLSGKRVLVVLDNASDAAQVRPLLPGTSTALVVVTSRNQLTGLVAVEGAHPFTLDVLSIPEACELLAGRLGSDRVAAEPDAFEEIIIRCARLPLALAIAAARLQQTGFKPAALAAALNRAGERLNALDVGDPAHRIRAVFSWSYQALTPQAARLFRLLGQHPGPDVSIPAAASLAALAPTQAQALLMELAQANLIAEHIPGRYRFHDLLRVYAAELARSVDPDQQRRAADRRLLDHYLHTAHLAAMLLTPNRDPIALDSPEPGVIGEELAALPQALAWFATERPALVTAVTHAARHGLNQTAWRLAWTLGPYLSRQGHYRQWTVTQYAALQAAQQAQDRSAQAAAHRALARGHARLGDHTEATAHFRRALDLFTGLANAVGQADTHLNIAHFLVVRGHLQEALDHDQQALELYQEADHLRGQGSALNCIGWVYGLLGEHRQTLHYSERALVLLRRIGARTSQAHAWDSVGHAHHHLGDHRQAVNCYQQALALWREAGDRCNEAQALAHLGDAYQAMGDDDRAMAARRQASRIIDDLDRPPGLDE